MLSVVGEYLSDMNAGSKKPQNLVLFQFALEHVARISGIVSQPGAQICIYYMLCNQLVKKGHLVFRSEAVVEDLGDQHGPLSSWDLCL